MDDGLIEIVVVGAHLSGMPLNGELTSLGGVFRRAVTTTADYRLHALAGGPAQASRPAARGGGRRRPHRRRGLGPAGGTASAASSPASQPRSASAR